MSKENLTKTAVLLESMKSPKAGWILFVITAVLLLVIVIVGLAGINPMLTVLKVFHGNNPDQSNNIEGPLGIGGKWTYTTYFNENDPQKHKYKAVRGQNILIRFDGCGYTMQGKRTQYMEWNSNTFVDYPHPITIKFSRTGLTPDSTSFYFYFEVQGSEEADRSVGFVELQIDRSNTSKMEGDVHYLYDDGKWSKAHITFERQR